MKDVIRDLNKEQEIIRFNPLQMVFAVYSIAFMYCCRHNPPLEPYLDFIISTPVFIVLLAIAVILSAMVLIYNQKNETRQANKTLSYIFAAANICFGVCRLMNFV